MLKMKKMLTSSVKGWRHYFLCNKEMSKIPNNRWKLMKIANIDRESLHIFWTTWEISMKFSGKMWFMIISKVTEKQGFILSLEDTFLEKPQGGSNWLSPAFLELKYSTLPWQKLFAQRLVNEEYNIHVQYQETKRKCKIIFIVA